MSVTSFLDFSKKLVTDTRPLALQAKHEWPYQLAFIDSMRGCD